MASRQLRVALFIEQGYFRGRHYDRGKQISQVQFEAER
jgi:hypothetical protein